MVTIQGTERIKGVLDLASIRQQLVKGQVLHLKDDDFWNADVQTALKMGWVVSKGTPTQAATSQYTGNRKIKCVNTHHRSISMRQNEREIRPGQTFVLPESDMDTPAVRAAVAKGMIKPLGVADAESEDSEGKVYVKKRLEGVALTPEHQTEPTVDLGHAPTPSLQLDEPDGEGIVRVDLDTNEELSSPTIIKDNKGVTWNKSEEISGPSNIITDENPAPVDPNVGDPKRTSVVVDPNKARLNAYVANKDQNITFVDRLEKQERIASHPKLKDKPIPQEEGTVIIEDIDDDEARIAAHPVLSKQPRDAGVDFIDDLDTIERVESHPVLGKKNNEE